MNNEAPPKLSRRNSTTQITKPKYSTGTSGAGRPTTRPKEDPEKVVRENTTLNVDEKQPELATSEFRLLKKIAELTQVVHMLFQSSHTNETELNLVKERAQTQVDRLIEAHQTITHSFNQEIKEKNDKIQGNLWYRRWTSKFWNILVMFSALENQIAQFNSSSEASLRLVQFDAEQSKSENANLQQKCEELNQNLG